MKIGIVDLCTPHPQNFMPILRDFGCEVSCVWDNGDTRPPGFTKEFAEKFNISHICKNLEEMVDKVNAVTIHGANWDTHIERALPFIKAGKFICIDKPIIGKASNANKLIGLNIKYPGKIFGGSACQFAEEIIKLKENLIDVGLY